MSHPDVILVDPSDTPIGTAPKFDVHTSNTPLHRAFSCHVVDSRGRFLLSRRALGKTWAGTWTNAFCGHPTVGEDRVDALVRHARFELGVELDAADVELLIGDFAYRAIDASGIMEHEICPVYRVRADIDPRPNPDEVMGIAWVEAEVLDTMVTGATPLLSPWVALQWAEHRHLPVPAVHDAWRL